MPVAQQDRLADLMATIMSKRQQRSRGESRGTDSQFTIHQLVSLTGARAASTGIPSTKLPGSAGSSLTSEVAMRKARRVALVAAASAASLAAAIVIPISLQPKAYSRAELDAMTSQIGQEAANWKSRGIILSAWGPDGASRVVLIHLAKYSPAAEHILEAHYGRIVEVSHESQTSSGS